MKKIYVFNLVGVIKSFTLGIYCLSNKTINGVVEKEFEYIFSTKMKELSWRFKLGICHLIGVIQSHGTG